MTAPFVYVRTHSVSLPGAENGDGVRLAWCASYDGGLIGGGNEDADWRIFKVDDFDAFGVPQAGAQVVDIDSGTVSLPKQKGGPYNRDEVGYGAPTVGWPEFETIIPNEAEDIGEVTGLCAIMVSRGSDSSWAYFVVRRRTEHTRALICYPFSTLAAYSGGSGTGASAETYRSLYSSLGPQRTRRVSIDRPFKNFSHDGDKEALCIQQPFRLQAFLGRYKGFETIDVCTSFDLDSDAGVLDGVNVLISVGHDEYWSNAMRDRVQAFVRSGGNVAFFSGNTAWWKVRFEDDGRTMACFKSSLEDPLAGDPPEELTGHFCDCPAAGLAGSHEAREENTLTGVSYRRGILGFSALGYTILDPDDDSAWGNYGINYFDAIPGGPARYGLTFGEGVFQLETDGAEYDLDPQADGAPVLTGRDGTPSNFRILAALDLRSSTSVSQAGLATLGYYTNVGTVFTAATTDWAPKLVEDGDVGQITRNVIDDLYVRHSRAAWTLPPRVYPRASWNAIDTVEGSVSAITALVQGQLLMQGAEETFARDAENPWTALAAPTLERDAKILSYGSDAWGTYTFGGRDDGTIGVLRGGVYSAEGWDDVIGPLEPGDAGQPTGIAGFNGHPLVMLTHGETTTLYKVFTTSDTWRKLGPVYPPIRAITGFDGRLFGVRDGGPPRVEGSNSDDELDLYSREGTNYDLTWTKIGTVPARTYAIAAYYGRLYALQAEVPGDPVATTVYWRAAVADVPFNVRFPSLLFLNGATIAVGSLSGAGLFLQTGAGSLDFSYTHATRANDGLVFFYHRPTQSGVIVRFAADATYEKVQEFAPSAFDQWDLMAYVRCGARDWSDYSDVSGMQEKIILYRNNGEMAVGSFDSGTGDYTEEWTGSGQATSLSHIVCTWAGDLLLYKSSNGAAAWGRVGNDGEYHETNSGTMASGQDQVVAAGNTYLLFYDDSGPGPAALNALHTTLTNVSSFNIRTGRKLASCENGLVFDYNPGAGGGKIYGLTADASASTDIYADDVSKHGIVLRADGPEGFGAGWSTIIGLGLLD